MAAGDRSSGAGAVRLRIVVSNDGPVQRGDASRHRFPASRAGDGWYHEEAVELERLARERRER